MPTSIRVPIVACAALFAAVATSHGCDDDDETVTSTAGAGGQAGMTGAGGFTGPTIEVRLTLVNAVPPGPGRDPLPIEGVEVCILDVPLPCVTSDVNGLAVVRVPASSPIWATLVKDLYMSALVGAVTGDEDLELRAPLINASLADVVAGAAGIEIDPQKGHVGFFALGQPTQAGSMAYPPIEGVSFTVDPPPANGPYYLNEIPLIDMALTATGPQGGGLSFNSEPGNAVLTATHPTLPCEGFIAHPRAEPNTYDIRFLAGFVTYVTVLCGEPVMGTGGAGGTSMGGMGGTNMGGSSMGGSSIGGMGGAGGN
ncbi:MAG TPA: hypothetical protein VFB62_14880 [Polyangiaceae bacterium]|jgi:hypothetical protein|nr:hypothetical protein [Polyangiaceae bacterium]